jgi:hypothetical protein
VEEDDGPDRVAVRMDPVFLDCNVVEEGEEEEENNSKNNCIYI